MQDRDTKGRFIKGHIPKSKNKSFEILYGIKKANELKEKNRIASLGKHPSEATRIKRSNALKNHEMTKNTREKISQKLKIFYENHEHHTKNKHRTIEIKKKISMGSKGNRNKLGWKTPENTKEKLSKAFKGNKSHFWRGGKTKQTGIQRSSYKMQTWRKTIFERDDYICQKCGKRGGILNAHHIKSFAEFPELRFEIDNGLTLCENCHKNIYANFLPRTSSIRPQSFL